MSPTDGSVNRATGRRARPGDAPTEALQSATVPGPINGVHPRLDPTEPIPEEGGPEESRRPPIEPTEFAADEATMAAEALAHVRLDPPLRDDSIGRLAHYDILSVIGRGGMGVVVRGFDSQLCRTVAIKLMGPQFAFHPRSRERFFREARAAAAINHPNIVTIHSVSEHAGVPLLVMEFVGGRTLMDRIEASAPLRPADVLRISLQIAGGLAAAHQQGIIHRDIKPANILLEEGIERVKITDFGLARVAMEHSDLTSQGVVVGTPAYMSPEQVDGGALDARSDLFSLGCVMFAMTTGSSPFRAENALAIARRITGFRQPSLAEVGRDVPPYLARIVDRLLEKDPADRYQSAAELVEELTGHLARLNIGTSSQVGFPIVEKPKRPRRPRIAATLGAIAAVAVIAAAAGLALWPKTNRPVPVPDPGPAPEPAATRAPSPPPRMIRVSRSGPADFASLSEAVRQAGPGCTITVEDAATYDEPSALVIDPGRSSLKLRAPAGATLRAPAGSPVLKIQAAEVQVSGLHFEPASGQHAIELTGRCGATVIEDCRIACPADSPVAAVYLHASAAGGPKGERIVLRRLHIRCGGVGVVLGGTSDTKPVQAIDLTDCVIQGHGRDYGIPLVIQTVARDIRVTRNLFSTGAAGISLHFLTPRAAEGVVIARNTMGQLLNAFTLNETPPDQGIRIADNLIADADTLQAPSSAIGPYTSWFQGNWWERSPNLAEDLARPVATLIDPLPMESRDPDSGDYLKPAGDRDATPGRHSTRTSPD